MCGFIGIIRREPISTRTLYEARDIIAHRGPDEYGQYFSKDRNIALGFRRLSIIDLSPKGHQPMQNENGTIWIVYNGEIYNFIELRKKLESLGHYFNSNSDTETIIHGYEEWGTNVLKHLRGMFAFALWDANKKCVFLARDRLGIKPLFYYSDSKQIIFASEIKAILSVPNIDKSIFFRGIYDYLTYNYVPEPYTVYKRINKLPSGHFLIVDSEEIRISREEQYWDLDLNKQSANLKEDDVLLLIKEKVKNAVNSHMIADVPIGLFLSGGMDSSTIAFYMAMAQSDPIQTFSIGFDVQANNELPYAQVVANKIKSIHREEVISLSNIEHQLTTVVQVYDEPYADFSCIPTMAVSSLANKFVKVVLSGEGGDEAFAGYGWYKHWVKLNQLAQAMPKWSRRACGWAGKAWLNRLGGENHAESAKLLSYGPVERYGALMGWISREEKHKLIPPDRLNELSGYDDYWYYRKFWHNELDDITKMQYLDVKTYLPNDLLVKVDRASMAFSLETRVPMLDHTLLEIIFSIPVNLRFKNGQTKYLLRQAMRDHLPPITLTRGKMGFNPPIDHWIHKINKKWIYEELKNGSAVRGGLLTSNAIDYLNRFRWGAKIWNLLILEFWAKKYLGV